MSPIRCLIVDDEELARTLLCNYVGRLPQLELAGSCADAIEALSVLQEQPVDLILLDIQMPGLTGVEFIRTLQHKPAVVFTTAYSEYALESYNLDGVDYLLKPFSFERFVQAINKVTTLLGSRQAVAAIPTDTGSQGKDFVLVKADHRIHRIKYADILFIQSMREYAAFYTRSGRILSLTSLKNLEEELPADQFIRIHKSYIVSIPKIDTMEGNTIYIGQEKLPVGANYREAVMSRVF